MHIYLVGFMAVGKTTFGKKLARALALPFIDTDKLIETRTNKSIEKLFAELGEDKFRELETEVLHSLPINKTHVVATGGGLPCYNNNMEYINKSGFTVYLCAETAFIYSRLIQAKTPRPLVKGLKGEQLLQFITDKLAAREPFYNQSKLVIELPVKDPESLVNTVVSAYRDWISQA